MTGTQEVHVSLLHQHYILLVCLAVNISACNGMMVVTVHATHLDILTIEFQYLTNTFHSLHPKVIVEMLVWQFDAERIEVRNIRRPEFWILDSMRQSNVHCIASSKAFQLTLDSLSVYIQGYGEILCTSLSHVANGDVCRYLCL